jgi:hypothetical protein
MTSGYFDPAHSDVVGLKDKGPISVRRVLLAFLLTPALISLAVAAAMPHYAGLPNYFERVLRTWPFYFFLGALLPTFFLGVPAFLVLRKFLRLSFVNCAFVGAFVASLPWVVLGLFPTGRAWTGQRATIIDGEYTAYGWQQFGLSVLMIVIIGALGGAIFWLLAAAKTPKGRQ